MPAARHLLIPCAAVGTAEPPPLWPAPTPDDRAQRLPHLAQLLRHLHPVAQTDSRPDTPAMPYETVLAGLLDLPAEPGRVPWAAFETRTTGTPCGWVKPGHLQVGTDHVRLGDSAQLGLDEAESRALLAAAAPYFAEDGIQLRYVGPTAWLASGEPLRGLTTWSTDRLAGQRITPDVLKLADGPSAALWQRLHNEMQMLFYAHPVNDERTHQRRPLVNAFWLTGTGTLDALPPPAPHVVVENRLCGSAAAQDPDAYIRAWQAVDADSCRTLLADCRAGQDVRLTLAGERRAITFAPRPASLWSRLTARFAPTPGVAVLDTL